MLRSENFPAALSVVPHADPQDGLRARWRTFLLWGSLVGLAFFSVYPTMNWLTGLRAHQYALFIEPELGVPFIPAFIWLYLSMYGLFALPPFFLGPESLRRLGKELILATVLSGVVFLVLPARLGFERVLPDDAFHRAVFETLFAVDRPFNLVPSLHVVYSTAIILAISAQLGLRGKFLLLAWLVLVMASTVLVHQHHFLDVISGFLLAWFMRSFWRGSHA